MVEALGVDREKLIALRNNKPTDANINEYGRFDDLKATIDKQKAKTYLEQEAGVPLSAAKVNMRAATVLRQFLICG